MVKTSMISFGIGPPKLSRFDPRRNHSIERLEQRHLLAGDLGNDLWTDPLALSDGASRPDNVEAALYAQLPSEFNAKPIVSEAYLHQTDLEPGPIPFSIIAYEENWNTPNDAAGWTSNTAKTNVEVVASGGNPGGYLRSFGTVGATFDVGASTQIEALTDDLRTQVSAVSVDVKLVSGAFDGIWLRFRHEDFTQNGWKFPLTDDYTLGEWKTLTVTFDPFWSDDEAIAADWVKEPNSPGFSETLSDVYSTEIRVSGEGPLDTGIDNFIAGIGSSEPPFTDAHLHDYGPEGQFFYDAETELYWYDPDQFVGVPRNEIDLFVQQNPIWNWATELQIDALSGKASHDGSPLTTIMGASQSTFLNGDERWIGYYDQSSQPNGWFVETSDDLRRLDNASSLQNIETRNPGAWLVSQSDIGSASYVIRVENDHVVIRDTQSGNIVLEGTDSLTLNLQGVSATVNLEGLENLPVTIKIIHQKDDVFDFGQDWIVDPLSDPGGNLTHVVHKSGVLLNIMNDSPFTNPVTPYDTNRDGRISPQDILLGLNKLSRKSINGEVKLPESSDPLPKYYLDVTGDGRVSPRDLLRVLNHLSRIQPAYKMLGGEFISPAVTQFATQISLLRSAHGDVDTFDPVLPSSKTFSIQNHPSESTASSSMIHDDVMEHAHSLTNEQSIDQDLIDTSLSLPVDWVSARSRRW